MSEHKKRIITLIRSLTMLVLTGGLLVSVALAWYASNKVAKVEGGFGVTANDQIQVEHQSVFRIEKQSDRDTYIKANGQLTQPYPLGYMDTVKGILDGSDATKIVYYSVTIKTSNPEDTVKRTLNVDLQTINGGDWFSAVDSSSEYTDASGNKYNMCDVFQVRLNNIMTSTTVDDVTTYTSVLASRGEERQIRTNETKNQKVITSRTIYDDSYEWDPATDITLIFELRLDLSVFASNTGMSKSSLSNKTLQFKYMYISDTKVGA